MTFFSLSRLSCLALLALSAMAAQAAQPPDNVSVHYRDPAHFTEAKRSFGLNANDADAHLKRTIMGREVVIAVTDGQLDLGPWEQIFYGEFDGLRRKRVLVKIIGE